MTFSFTSDDKSVDFMWPGVGHLPARLRTPSYPTARLPYPMFGPEGVTPHTIPTPPLSHAPQLQAKPLRDFTVYGLGFRV